MVFVNEQVEEKGYSRPPAGSYLPMRAASATQQQQQRVAHQSPSPAPLRAANSFSGGSMVVSQNGFVNSRTGNPVILRCVLCCVHYDRQQTRRECTCYILFSLPTYSFADKYM